MFPVPTRSRGSHGAQPRPRAMATPPAARLFSRPHPHRGGVSMPPVSSPESRLQDYHHFVSSSHLTPPPLPCKAFHRSAASSARSQAAVWTTRLILHPLLEGEQTKPGPAARLITPIVIRNLVAHRHLFSAPVHAGSSIVGKPTQILSTAKRRLDPHPGNPGLGE